MKAASMHRDYSSRKALPVMNPHHSERRRLQRPSTCRFVGATCAAGLLLSCAAAVPAARANLITNGGFEASTTSLPGWTVTGDGIAIDSFFSNAGANDAAFTATSVDPSPGTLSQTVATTAGTQYTLAFSLLDESGGYNLLGTGAEIFAVSFGGFAETLTATDFQSAGQSYANYSFTVPGSAIMSASTTLSFEGVQDPNSFSAVFNLDNVSLKAASPTPVPEPSSLALLATAVGFSMLGLVGSATPRR